jgi:hypothetical protein
MSLIESLQVCLSSNTVSKKFRVRTFYAAVAVAFYAVRYLSRILFRTEVFSLVEI